MASRENHSRTITDIVETMTSDQIKLLSALEDILSKVQDSHPELLIKYRSLLPENKTKS